MPRYTFSIRAGDQRAQVAKTIELSDDANALAYASDLARLLQESQESLDANWLIKVSDDERPLVLALPILAACA